MMPWDGGEEGSVWDVVGKLLVSLMTAGILAMVAVAWNTREVLYEIKTDIAVIKAVQVTADRAVSGNSGRITDLEKRVLGLERSSE